MPTLSMTRKTANTLITASGFNTNMDECEAAVNALDGDNFADDAVTAAKLNADVVRSGYGLLQHSDGSLYVDVYGVLANAGTNGVEWGRSSDILFSANATTPDGFTDLTSTHSARYLRVGSTGLATGGSATHSHNHNHTAGTYSAAAHTHEVGSYATNTPAGGAGGAPGIYGNAAANAAITGTSGSGGGSTITGSSAADATTASTAPLYVDVKMYSKS